MTTFTYSSMPSAPETGDSGAMTFTTQLSRWAAERGDRTAVTFMDHVRNPDGHAVSLTWRELDDRVGAVALEIGRHARPGDRAAVLVEQSVDYVVAFLGAIRAGVVAVPLFPVALSGHSGRLEAVLGDCAPEVVLTTVAGLEATTAFLAGIDRAAAVVAVDDLAPCHAAEHTWHRPSSDDVAYLQYTSGSTRTPAGVVLRHRNVIANAHQSATAYGVVQDETSTVSWLPLFHDMGLILGIGCPVTVGAAAVLMDPLAFLERPARWLSALSASPGGVTAAPNFAYAYAAARVSEDEASYLELSRVVTLIDGSEPLQPGSIDRFREAFEPCGLRAEAHRPSYGLAEATVLVTASDPERPPLVTRFDRDRLADGVAVPAATDGAVTDLVCCGRPIDQAVAIVDPGSGAEVAPGHVGEIWISGPNVGTGYWGRTEESAAVFGRRLPGADATAWLATGDLGTLVEGQLYVTGRMKDLIIVDGRNHYPQDVEQTAEEHEAFRRHSAGAFAVPAGNGEVAVLVVERARGASDEDVTAALPAVRRAVAGEHGLMLRDVVVLAAGQVPRTSSAKISRARCRAQYLDGTFAAARLA